MAPQSEGDSKISLSGVILDIGYLRFRYAEGLLKVTYAVADIVGMSLGRHLDRAVRQVPHCSGQLTASCDAQGRESKSHTLDTAFKYYVFGAISHLRILCKIYTRHKRNTGICLYAVDVVVNLKKKKRPVLRPAKAQKYPRRVYDFLPQHVSPGHRYDNTGLGLYCLSAHYNKPITVKLLIEDADNASKDGPSKGPDKGPAQRRNELINDPAVKTLLTGLGATITNIEEQ